MTAPVATKAPPPHGDELASLDRLETLLERERDAIAARDAATLAAVADEREHVAARLMEAARARRIGPPLDATVEGALLARYRRLHERQAIQARVLQVHAERNARAIGVLAQATGQSGLYDADGRVALRFVAR